MSFDSDPEAKLNTYGGRVIENKRSRVDTGVPRGMMRQRLIEQLASTLVDDAVTVTDTAYDRTHELRVYILTSSQLEKYVQHRVERLHPSIPSVRWESP